MDTSSINVGSLKAAVKNLGYDFFENGDYNLNIIGIRANPGTPNKFDDAICVAYKENDEWKLKKYTCTTDPGLYYLNNPCNVNGTAILKEGQYKGGFRIGRHKDQYRALVQNKNLPLYRDNDRDNEHDMDESTVSVEMAGINIHHSSATGTSTQVDKWSAGCQVFASISDFDEFMTLIDKSAAKYGNVFTYTLINQKDL